MTNEELRDMISTLLLMKYKANDRDVNYSFMPYDNFKEFYDINNHLFYFGFSTENKLVAAIIKLYVMRQLKALHNELGYDAVSSLVYSTVQTYIEEFKEILEQKWGSTLDDIRAIKPMF